MTSQAPSRPKEYVIAKRDESLKEFIVNEGKKLAPGVEDSQWVKLNRKKLRIGDRVFIPLTDKTKKQLQEYQDSVIRAANTAVFRDSCRFIKPETPFILLRIVLTRAV